jgi:hypothetical protein
MEVCLTEQRADIVLANVLGERLLTPQALAYIRTVSNLTAFP